MADDIEIRPCDPRRDIGLAENIRDLDLAAFAYGHPFFKRCEVDVLRANPLPGKQWSATWLDQLPSVSQHFCAFKGDLLVGHMMVFEDYPPGQYAVIEPMNVRPGFEGRGIGRRMWAYAQAALKTHPYQSRGFRLWVMRKNRNAMTFYLRVGCSAASPQSAHAFVIGNHREEATELTSDFQ